MTGLMRAHQWRYTLKVGDTIDARQQQTATATAAPILIENASSWKEAQVVRLDWENVEVRERNIYRCSRRRRKKCFQQRVPAAKPARYGSPPSSTSYGVHAFIC